MSTWMDKPTFTSQYSDAKDMDIPVPRPDHFPEDPSDSRSYWIREHPISLDQSCISTPLPEEVDVVIIGSGITGASVAYQLSEEKPELRVALVEARGVCTGATGRNGGLVARPECYHLVSAAKVSGDVEAIRQKRLMTVNRDMMVACIEKLGAIEEVDLRMRGNIMVFESSQERDDALQDLEFARSHGYEPENYYLTPEETSEKYKVDLEICKYGAMCLENAGSVYPRKLVHVLLRTAMERMSRFSLHPYTPVEAVTRGTGERPIYEVRTTKGIIITQTVFHATNAYAGNICPDLQGSKGVFGVKAHMLAVQPNVSGCNSQLLHTFGYADCWHYLHQRPNLGPFLYGLADAEILNDYDDTVTLPGDHPVRERMTRFLERVFPNWFEDIEVARSVTHDWTGIQGLTMSGSSIVGRPTKDSPGEFCSVGHNGEGMGRCFSLATVATHALLAYINDQSYTLPEWFPRDYGRNI